MQRDTRTQLLACLALAAMLVGSAVLATGISASIGRHRLAYTDRAEENDPPQVALGIAMGAFRGIFVNWLWIRANQLKEDGRYYEAIDLADSITRLQPRFPQVWVFHAWNMAYNISVATHTFPERWQWVQAGIRLLRDRGIPANPNDLLLHKELAYLFLHKIQGYTDDANGYYKRQFAVEWQIVLGPPPPPDPKVRDRDAAIQRYVDWLTLVAEAPETLDALYAKTPKVQELMGRLRARFALEPGMNLLLAYETNRAVAKSGQRAYLLGRMREGRKEMAELYADPEFAQAWPALLNYTRKRVLTDTYHMEPDRMVRYTREYGPIDWRHPAAHGLYWAARGVENAIRRFENRNRKDFDFTNADRIVIQAIQELWRTGEVYVDFLAAVYRSDQENIFYMTMPNVHFVESYGNTLATLRDRSEYDADRRPYSVYSAGYENFLIDAVRFFFRRGQLDLAQKYYEQAATYPHANQNDPDRPARFAKPLAEFVYDESDRDEYTRPSVAAQEVVGSLQGAYVSGLLGGDTAHFARQFEFAKQAHRYFMEKQRRISNMNPRMSRMDLLPADFRLLAANVFAQLISVMDPDDAETMYDNAPEDLKRYGYDAVRANYKPLFDELAKSGGRTFDQVFPEPPGMEAYRIEMRRLADEDRRLRIEMK
jgi:hypothetical protein